jgi:DNA-binding CsgD family transcriptional regulator
MREDKKPMGAESEFSQLTDLEGEVVKMIVCGHTYRESATRLGMTIAQLEASMSGLFEKFGVRSRHDLAKKFGDCLGGFSGVREPRSPSPSSDSGNANTPTE